MFENKFQTDKNKNTSIHNSAGIAKEEQPDTVDDNNRCLESNEQFHCYQACKSNKPHTFASAKLKSKNQQTDVKYEAETATNLSNVTDSRPNIPEHMSGTAFMDTKGISHPKETTESFSVTVTPLTQEDTRITLGQELIEADEMMADSTTSSKADMKFSSGIYTESFKKASDIKSLLKAHIENRSKYKCNKSGKSITDKKCLTRHSQMHMDERPYKGETGGKALTRNAKLTRHSQIYTRERQHMCEICGESIL